MQRIGEGPPTIIYIDDENFPGAVRVTGSYTVADGEIVRIKTFLRRDGKIIATLPEIASAKDKAIDELLAAIQAELEKIANRFRLDNFANKFTARKYLMVLPDEKTLQAELKRARHRLLN